MGSKVFAFVQIGEDIVPVIISDVIAFKRWLAGNSDAADTAQLQQNDTEFATMIAEEQAKAAGGTVQP